MSSEKRELESSRVEDFVAVSTRVIQSNAITSREINSPSDPMLREGWSPAVAEVKLFL